MAVVAIIVPTIAMVEIACQPPAFQKDDGSTTSSSKKTNPPPESSKTPEVTSAEGGTKSGECETVPPNNKCGLAPQCGCLDTETCAVTTLESGATSCVTGGAATLGRPCATPGDCMAGLGCIYGACRPYCKTALSKCDVGGTGLCVSQNDANNAPYPNGNFCTLNCDPRDPSGVCGSNSCQWFPTLYGAGNKVSDCNFPGATPAQMQCQTSSECAQGLACIQHPVYGLECEKWCRIGTDADCGDVNFHCKDVWGNDAPVINGVKEGICQDEAPDAGTP